MSTINIDFQVTHPTEKDGEGNPSKWFYEGTAARWLAEYLETRISTSNPMLESRVAAELRATGEFTGTAEELEYIRTVIVNAQVDNLFKGQILAKFPV